MMVHRSNGLARLGALLVALACPAAAGAQASDPSETPAESAAPQVVEDAPAPAVEETPAPSAPPDRIGPFEMALGEHSTLGVGFAAQLRLTVSNAGAGFGEDGRETENIVELRRVRWLLRGSFFDGRLRAQVQLSTAPSSLEIVDVWAEQRIAPALRLRFGQFKVPFTRHRQQSYAQLPLTDWDVAAVRFGAERQLGAMVHDGQRGDGHVTYAAGVFTGVNARAAFERGVAETYGEPMPNPSNLRSPGPPADVHPEVVGHVGYSTEGMDFVAPTDAEGGKARVFAGMSAAVDARPVEAREYFLRLAPEILLKAHHLALDAVAYLGFVEETTGSGIPLGMVGLVADCAYRFHPRAEVAARYSRTDTLDDMRTDARARADALVAAADPAEQAELAAQYADAGRVRSRQEIAGGLNVTMVGRSLAFQTDFGWVHTERVLGGPDDDELRLRTQLQLSF